MKNHYHLAVGAALLLGIIVVPSAYGQEQKPLSSGQMDSFMQQYGSKDGTISLEQANKAAEIHFKALDTDHDGTVDQKELAPAGVSSADFGATDPDKDKLMQQGEYTNLVKQKFNAADANHNGKLTKDELNSQPGQALVRLLQ